MPVKQLYIRYIVLMEGSMVKVGQEYHWSVDEVKHIKQGLENKIEAKIERETNEIRQAMYELQLGSLEIQEVTFH